MFPQCCRVPLLDALCKVMLQWGKGSIGADMPGSANRLMSSTTEGMTVPAVESFLSPSVGAGLGGPVGCPAAADGPGCCWPVQPPARPAGPYTCQNQKDKLVFFWQS